jgi:hypothetical protein
VEAIFRYATVPTREVFCVEKIRDKSDLIRYIDNYAIGAGALIGSALLGPLGGPLGIVIGSVVKDAIPKDVEIYKECQYEKI